MTHAYELTAITRLQSIETAERYLIARTHAELDAMHDRDSAAAVNRPVWAIGLACVIVVLLQMGYIQDFLTAVV